MFARVTRAATSPEKLDEAMELFAQSFLPQIRDLPGFVGAGALGDRSTGQVASITYWGDADAMRASEDAASTSRQQATQGGMTPLDLQRYEMVIVERAAPAAANVYVRSNEVDASPDKLEDLIRFVRETVTPTVRSQKGFRGMLMGVDRSSGHCLVSSIWESAADRDASEAAVRDQRGQASQVAGASNVRVEHYEVMYLEMKQAVTP